MDQCLGYELGYLGFGELRGIFRCFKSLMELRERSIDRTCPGNLNLVNFLTNFSFKVSRKKM